MNRRDFLKTCSAAVLTAAAASPLQAALAAKERPHILFIMTDQQRGDWMGCMGDSAAYTPTLDALAAEGALFTRAYASAPTCIPARVSLLTGQSPWNHGMLGYSEPMPSSYPNDLPRLLAESGYKTVAYGKQHFNGKPHGYQTEVLYEGLHTETSTAYVTWMKKNYPKADPLAAGIEFNCRAAEIWQHAEEAHPTRWLTDRSIEFLEAYDFNAQPLFMKISYHRPHSPYDPPQRWHDFFKDRPEPEAFVADWAKKFEKPIGGKTAFQGKFADIAETRRAYRAAIAFIDEQIRRVIETLAKRGMLEKTLIIFTADHGDMRGEHNLWRKGYPYEGSVRIPMILRWPQGMIRQKRGIRCDEAVELRDVAPTCLEVAGVTSTPEPMDGISLLAFAREPKKQHRPWIDLEHATCYADWNQWTALTNGKEKYIYFAGNDTEQFFDLTTDPHELRNLITSPAAQARVKYWRKQMIDHLTPRGPLFVKDGKLMKRAKPMKRRDQIKA